MKATFLQYSRGEGELKVRSKKSFSVKRVWIGQGGRVYLTLSSGRDVNLRLKERQYVEVSPR